MKRDEKAVVLDKSIVRGFVGSLLTSGFDGAVESPEFHDECWELCTSKHKYVAVAAPRAHAKSSGITMGYGLATLLFRERRFMLLVSDTESQAALFLGNFKEQLQNNRELIELFDLKTDKDGKVLFIKDTETDIIVEFSDGHKFRIIVKGAEQKLRGLLWNGSRPDIILCDDMENDEAVMNKERREKMWNWFKKALLPCISDRGIVRIVGTILHTDSLLNRLMPDYKSSVTRHSELKVWMARPVGMWMSVKYKAHNKDFSLLLWPQKKNKQDFINLMNDAIEKGDLDSYSQEYLNEPLDPSNAFFRRSDFITMEPGDYDLPMNKYITVDLAVAQHEKADYSVFLIAGVDENRRVHVLDVIRQRLDAQEIVQTLVNLQRTYSPVMIGIEDMQVTKSIGPFLNEEMIRTQCFMNIVKLKHGGKDKIARAASIQARLRAKNVRFNKQGDWYINFEEECTRFPRDKHDDQVDALSYLGLMLESLIEAPTKQEMDEEEYNERLSSSYGGDSGRSGWCGY